MKIIPQGILFLGKNLANFYPRGIRAGKSGVLFYYLPDESLMENLDFDHAFCSPCLMDIPARKWCSHSLAGRNEYCKQIPIYRGKPYLSHHEAFLLHLKARYCFLFSEKDTFFVTETEMIEGCKNGDRKAQKLLYDRFAPVMFGVCLRYMKGPQDAEDVLLEGLFKAMTKVDQFQGEGSFEGWIRRIVVNECLMALRKNDLLRFAADISTHFDQGDEVTVEDDLQAQDLLNLLEHLPPGYRTVFNLYVVEGYKHREIADLLDISINTSKSQLILAKKKMESLVAKVFKNPSSESPT